MDVSEDKLEGSGGMLVDFLLAYATNEPFARAFLVVAEEIEGLFGVCIAVESQ